MKLPNIQFSIIITTYNRPEKLKRAIESVVNQSFENYELIIINDGSLMDYSTIEEYIKPYPQIQYFFKKNEERSIARHFGIDKSNADFICFLDDDDYFEPHHLKELIDEIEKQRFQPAIYHTLYKALNKDNSVVECPIPEYSTHYNLIEYYLFKGFIAPSAVCYHKQVLVDFPFDLKMWMCEDKEQLARAMTKYPVFVVNKFSSVLDRTGDNTWANGTLKNAIAEYHSFQKIFTLPILNGKLNPKLIRDKQYFILFFLLSDFYKELSIKQFVSFSIKIVLSKISLGNVWWVSKMKIKFFAFKIHQKLFAKSNEKRNVSDILKYEKSTTLKKLNIGCGTNNKKGWLNTDILPYKHAVYLDATKVFPIADSSFDYVFSEHMIEHIPLKKGIFMLNQCYRIMKPAGKIRITTPNLQFLIDLSHSNLTQTQQEYIDWSIETFQLNKNANKKTVVINNFFHNWGHCFLYDFESLKNIMEMIGFKNVKGVESRKSDDKELNDLEIHGKKVIPEKFNLLESFSVEASK